MKKVVYVSKGKIKCSSCGNYYYRWWMLSHQKKMEKKTGCSSFIKHSENNKGFDIFSAYGSGYDSSIFKVVDNYFYKKRSSIKRLIKNYELDSNICICDKCIQRFIKRKDIILVHSDFM